MLWCTAFRLLRGALALHLGSSAMVHCVLAVQWSVGTAFLEQRSGAQSYGSSGSRALVL